MNPKRNSVAGSLESSDVMISITPCDELEIEINSVVQAQWGRQIEELVRSLLIEYQVTKAFVSLHDKGARECTIRARLKTALHRSEAI